MNFREAKMLLEQAGYHFYKKSDGSHVQFKNSSGDRIIVPHHAGKELPPQVIGKVKKVIR